jgi:ubiquinone/menaquinone biosynthesis C-methylase UbiE
MREVVAATVAARLWSNNREVAAYVDQVELKDHQSEQLRLIGADYPAFGGRLLDVGCATGVFLGALAARYPTAALTGIDRNEHLLRLGRARLADVPTVTLLNADAIGFEPDAAFDVITAAGVLSLFEDFTPALDRWLEWLAPGGHLYVFGSFNSRDIDTIIRFRNNAHGDDWQSGLTAYSVATVSRHLAARGLTHEFRRFHLKRMLPPHDDPIRSFTVACADGSSLLVNGANVVSELYFLTIQR